VKLDKRAIAEMLEAEYVNGTAKLSELAEKAGCTWPRLAQIGKEMVPGYSEAAHKRKCAPHKFMCLSSGE
jgi:hypothetical protein